MKNKGIFIVVFVLLMSFIFSCSRRSHGNKEKVMVFAAASLTDVIMELADSFEIKYKVSVSLNLASSGTLARQMEQGELPGVYLSASKRWADYAHDLGVVVLGKQKVVAKNRLVFIAPKASDLAFINPDMSFDIVAALGNLKLVMGDPNHVPAGKYAKQSLEYFNWYTKVKRNILPTKDVRSALMVVELGESPLGIVYETDALKSKKVKILGELPEASHQPIVYVASLCRNNDLAKQFYAYLDSESANAIWESYGFIK